MPKTAIPPAVADRSLAPTRRDGTGITAIIARRASNWLRRRRIGRIEDLDDRILEDIGLTRADVLWARGLPLDHNPTAALNAVAHERRVLRDAQMRRTAGSR